jgi:hypothetical protein
LSWRPAKEQPPSDKRDDKTVNTDHTHIPLPAVAPSITCPDSDRCDITDVSVPPLRRSTPVISRFCPVLGWRTILQLLACRTTESNTFSIRNALWIRTEDDLLVQAVAKHSTSETLFHDWSEVPLELTGHSEQHYIERYRLEDTVVTLTFVFLCVTFRDSPSLRSSHVLTKDADSTDSSE